MKIIYIKKKRLFITNSYIKIIFDFTFVFTNKPRLHGEYVGESRKKKNKILQSVSKKERKKKSGHPFSSLEVALDKRHPSFAGGGCSVTFVLLEVVVQLPFLSLLLRATP